MEIKQIARVNHNLSNLMNNFPPQKNNSSLRQQKLQQFNTSNIITHQTSSSYIYSRSNPQEFGQVFSTRKTTPLNQQIIRDRNQIILHSSKLDKDVPNWLNGDTYKYYNRKEGNLLNQKKSTYMIDYPPKNLINYSNRSSMSTPRSRKSSQSDIFNYGTGKNDIYERRPYLKQLQHQISPKIGSVDTRNFELPKIPIKIGQSLFIDTHKPF